MPAKTLTAAVIGLECQLIEVEADLSPHSQPGTIIVGLPDKAVDEAKERVRSAIKNSSLQFPRGKITVNLAPADVKKEGPSFDLPIAISILAAAQEINNPSNQQLFIGELALDGNLRPVCGILSVALACVKEQIPELFVPQANAKEAALIPGLKVFPVPNLQSLTAHLRGENLLEPLPPTDATELLEKQALDSDFDFAFIRGQEQVKRALEIAAAGGHNILMSGPPGSGKTLLAKAFPTILPTMTLAESLEVSKIYSVAGLLPPEQPLILERPWRNPHHTASGVALVGGGAWPRPGEISLAHRGVLFLDEFPEFPRSVLENLRQPLEDGVISVSRAQGTLRFPAKFILLAAMNPCPCGYATDPDHPCVCGAAQIIKYQKKISGPLLDRIDLHVEVPKVKFEKLAEDAPGESSKTIRQRVQQARSKQWQRFSGLNIVTNAEMSSPQVKMFCPLTLEIQQLLKSAVEQFNLSARAYFRILRLSRTIADLADSEQIELAHVAEALQYRPKISE